MFVAQFLSGLGFSFVLPFFPFYFRALGVPDESGILMWMGWSSAAFGITMAACAPLWGMAADRYGRKVMVVRSMVAGSVILMLMGFATQPWHLLALRIIQGMFTGTITASIIMVISVTPSAYLGFSLGALQTSFLLGNSAGPLLGGIISDQYGFRVPCILASVLLFTGVLLVMFCTSESFSENGKGGAISFRTVKGIIRTSGFKLLLSIYFIIYIMNFMIVPILPLFIEALSGYSPNAVTLTGFIVSTTAFIAGISASVIGRLGDRFGAVRVLTISLVGVGLLSIPQSFAHSVFELFVERALLGVAVGGIIPSVNTLVSTIIPREKVGGAFGLTSSVTCLGMGAGPLIGGYLALFLGLRIPFAVMGAVALVTAFLLSNSVYLRKADPVLAREAIKDGVPGAED